jgi:hypothetical protein
MKKVVLRYGIYAGLAELVCFVLIWLFFYITHAGHKVQGVVGYINIFCPLLFVYFGIRYYRDHVADGSISFLGALKIGMLIVIIPTLSFALIETVYVLYIEPKFYENVAAYDIEQYRKTLSAVQFAAKMKELKQQLVMDKNPIYNFVGMVLTIGSVGVIMSLISSLLLMRRLKPTMA